MKPVSVRLWLNSIGAHGYTNLVHVRNDNATIDETVEVAGAFFHPEELGLTDKPKRFRVTIEEDVGPQQKEVNS